MSKRHHFIVSIIALACTTSGFAAIPVNLNHQSPSVLSSFVTKESIQSSQGSQASIKEVSADIDFNQTKHIRIKQMVAGYPVWGSDAIVHIPQGTHASLTQLTASTTMNGIMYKEIGKDLINTPAYVFQAAQADRALAQAVQIYQKKSGTNQYDSSTAKKELMVYIDKQNKAHWVYFITFVANAPTGMPAIPTYILDATTFEIYQEWDNLQTLDEVKAGGFGGNIKMHKLTYDGIKAEDHFPILTISRDSRTRICTLENSGVMVKDHNHKDGFFGDASVAAFKCDSRDSQHGNLYWDGESDAVNGAFSPANDALYIGEVIKNMYHDWYGLPALSFFGFPMMLKLNVHVKDFLGQALENAFFHPLTSEMYFGDGANKLYPLTSLGVGAHEISHGFTSQHSNLTYEHQSGGLNESFSDMAAQAAEFYSVGRNDWQIGPEIFKEERPLRYMDDPTKDGKSIGHIKDYNDELNVHYSSGVFNKAFYLLATSTGWTTHKAFDVMIQANMHYWTANSTFQDAACGVVKATIDYAKKDSSYDINAVKNAMQGVGIDTSHC